MEEGDIRQCRDIKAESGVEVGIGEEERVFVCRGEEESIWRILMVCQEVEYL